MTKRVKCLMLFVVALCISSLSSCDSDYSNNEEYLFTINVETIEEEAVEYFNLDEEHIDEIHTVLVEEHDRLLYDVKIYVGEKKYSLKADAGTGLIISCDDGQSQFEILPTEGNGFYGLDLATGKALNSVGLSRKEVDAALNVLDIKNKVYNVQYYYKGNKYTIKVDASTGEIME